MNRKDILARDSFLVNGDFNNGLNGWTYNDERRVTRQEGVWDGRTIGFMNAVNGGDAYQSITLATMPRPTPGRADYKLLFHYEAVQGAQGTLRINPGLGGEVDLTLVPSRLMETGPTVGPDGLLLDLYLVEYVHMLTLQRDEETVKLTVISPDNGGPGRPGAVRFALASVELVLEPLRLDRVFIDGEGQLPGDRLHLCFGASHELTLQLASDSVWMGTRAGLLVNDEEQDPEGVLVASPPWGREHPVIDPWTISCDRITQDIQIERSLSVRSQYTADTYLLQAVCGHFQLDVVALQGPQWYPVIDLAQEVELRVLVQSHYTETPLGNRMVKFMPNAESPLIGLDVVAQWANASDRVLNARLDPEHERELPSNGLQWTLDAVRSEREGPLALAVELPQASFAYPAMKMLLAHNRIDDADLRGPTFDLFVGQSTFLEVRSRSYYTGRDVPGTEVSFAHQEGTATPIRTQDNGWASFPFTATRPGRTQVVATVPSPYDGPDAARSFTFDFEVLEAVTASGPAAELALPLRDEAQRPMPVDAEIAEVRNPTFDPLVGESVVMGLKIRLSGTRHAASGVEVIFRAGPDIVRVMTNGEGWALFSWKVSRVGDMEVLATLDNLNEEVLDSARSHTFEFTALAANVWNDALIQLNTEPKTAWGERTLFPRTPQVHTITLLVDNATSHLLNRDICLGLKGYSSARELGLTSVEPALGVYRRLTSAGLSWRCIGTIGGAYDLQVEASRLLNLSPLNPMSLGPVPATGLS
ncbi:hypothetical protein [Pseudomonas sp. RIT288]|uniref:hypothetical protein n=1 Tax=Pseudomonas sp. RIT288 TaxID=1470589 RepID=UPI00044E2B0B|nr:hypothetical protein [Pseudomonas sp. RIT288]EZP31484.1 cable pili-associated 22 kda adhesin protein [Pseudomonas sp. RIT288]